MGDFKEKFDAFEEKVKAEADKAGDKVKDGFEDLKEKADKLGDDVKAEFEKVKKDF